MLTSHIARLLLTFACVSAVITAGAVLRIQTAEHPAAAFLVWRLSGAITLMSFVAIAGVQLLA